MTQVGHILLKNCKVNYPTHCIPLVCTDYPVVTIYTYIYKYAHKYIQDVYHSVLVHTGWCEKLLVKLSTFIVCICKYCYALAYTYCMFKYIQ